MVFSNITLFRKELISCKKSHESK